MWPIVIGLISAVYCGMCLWIQPGSNANRLRSVLSLRSFARRRIEFGQFLSSNKSLTVSRYFRLMALAMTEILFTTPLAIFMIWLNATASPIGPWRSWEDTHFAYSRVEQFPAIIWRSSHLTVIAMEFSRWVTPLCAIIFFIFFGFADEAQKNYRLVFWFVMKPFGFRPAPVKTSAGSHSIGYAYPHYLSYIFAYTYITRQYKPKAYTATSTSTTDSLPRYSPPASSSVFLDVKRPASTTSSLTDTIDDSFTQFSSPNPRSTLQSFPVILMTENPRHTLAGLPHNYYDLESQYSPSSVPSTPRPYSTVEAHNVGVAS